MGTLMCVTTDHPLEHHAHLSLGSLVVCFAIHLRKMGRGAFTCSFDA